MSQKKIAIIDHVGIKAGMDFYDSSLLQSLSAIGYEAFLFSNFILKNENIYSQQVFPFRVKENIFSVFTLLKNYRKAIRICEEKEVTHCILHGFRYGWIENYILQRIKNAGIKIILVVHDIESLIATGNSNSVNQIFESLADELIVHNQYSFVELKKCFLKVNVEKIHIIRHGNFIELQNSSVTRKSALEKLKLTGNKKHMLFFGHIKKSKGLDVLLNAMSKVDENISLIIAGRMRKHSFKEYEKQIDKLKLNDRVHSFIDYVTNDERELFFKAADCVALPYRKVYQSGVMLMAMSYKVPVIASDLEANKETIRNEENGLLFHSGDANDLTEKINRLFANKTLRENMSEQGYKSVKDENDWNKIALDYKKIIG